MSFADRPMPHGMGSVSVSPSRLSSRHEHEPEGSSRLAMECTASPESEAAADRTTLAIDDGHEHIGRRAALARRVRRRLPTCARWRPVLGRRYDLRTRQVDERPSHGSNVRAGLCRRFFSKRRSLPSMQSEIKMMFRRMVSALSSWYPLRGRHRKRRSQLFLTGRQH